uniref:Secreted protein n=1 Tax=Caenorhabditis tropicalis TaxID=1561998 RepID=A0A1I7TVT5_9PELO
MTNTKQLVFSATCSDAAYSPGADMNLEVSQITIVPVPLSLEDLQKAKEIIDNSIEVINALVDIGKALADDKEVELALDVIVGVGDILKGILKFMPEPDNPMVKNLEALENRVKLLGDKLNDHFDEMKTYISEVKFFMKIVSPTKVLIRYMRDCIKNPGPEAVQNFKRAYEEHTPLSLAYLLMSYLEQKSTNPLRLAMDNEKLKTKETYKKWEDIISRVLGQFMLLQAFANGLLGLDRKLNCDLLIELSEEVAQSMANLKEQWKLQDYYWDEVKEHFKKYIETHTDLNNSQKADGLQKYLNSFFTNDSFVICVFNECVETKEYIIHCPNRKEQLLQVRNTGKCNAFIYRSRQTNKKKEADFEKLRNQVESFYKTDFL